MKKIFLISYDYLPYKKPSSFRLYPIAEELKKNKNYKVIILTSSNNTDSKNIYNSRRVSFLKRFKLINLIFNYILFYFLIFKHSFDKEIDRVFVTSSKTFTAFFTCVFFSKKCPIYYDMRDSFVSNILYHNRLSIFFYPILILINKYTLTRAARVNLVSKGFLKTFPNKNNYIKKLDFYSHGVEDVFLNKKITKKSNKNNKIIVYAGNIGWGQGLSNIIPLLAYHLEQYQYKFIICGSGADKEKLISNISKYSLKNVFFKENLNRNKLINLYSQASIFFVHLNEIESLKMVIPSKIYEILTFKKPILFGAFVENLDNFKVKSKYIYNFYPNNYQQALEQVKNIEKNYNKDYEAKIPNKFYRTYISKNIVRSFLSLKR